MLRLSGAPESRRRGSEPSAGRPGSVDRVKLNIASVGVWSVVGLQNIQREHSGLLQLLPVVTMWIKNNTNLTEQEIKLAARLHPKEFEYAKRTSVAEMYRLAEKYKENRLYRDLIAIVMSEKGRKWVENTVAICKRIDL